MWLEDGGTLAFVTASIEERFVLGERVARGSAGEVLRATDRSNGAVVAVKRLHRELIDPQARARFEREARLLSVLRSPHVVQWIAQGDDKTGRPCIVLEWLDGMDLARLLQQPSRLSVEHALDLLRQCALGLAAVHAINVVHRDVKPSNFFLVRQNDGSEIVKLLDLGIARGVMDPVLTTAGIVVGSPAYMSPEQARGEEKLTPASDLYALGAMLFELLTGRRAFPGTDPFAVLAKILLGEIPRPRELRPELSGALDSLVARAMEREPSRRFSSADDFVHAIDSLRAAQNIGTADSSALAVRERRVVTVLFAVFGLIPGEAAALELFRYAVERQGGAVEEALGGRAIGVFGAAFSHGDEAVRAARAALAVRESVEHVQLSLATGGAVAGAGGLAGAVLDGAASKLTDARNGVPIDEATAALLPQVFVVDGQRETLLLLGERTEEPNVPRLVLGRRTQTVGREREQSFLQGLYEDCVEESAARVAFVTGPAGGGKSRLRRDFLHWLRELSAPPELLLGRGDLPGTGSPYGHLADALRRSAGFSEHAPLAERRARLRARVARTVPREELQGILEFLGELCSVPWTESAALRAAQADPILMADRVREAWERFLWWETARGPVVLVLEDFQWGDAPSARLVEAALRRTTDRSFLVLAIGRPELLQRFPRLWASFHPHEVRLGPLPRSAALTLARSVLGTRVPEATLLSVVDRAEGNPFFLEELLRAAGQGEGAVPPDTVLGLVQARLDALPALPRRILRAASVYGARFDREMLQALTGTWADVSSMEDALALLVEREVLARRAGTDFRFLHELQREAAYASLTEEDRKSGHRAAAEHLAQRSEPDATVLASHFDRGGVPSDAARWYLAAAEEALEAGDFPATISLAERGAFCAAAGLQSLPSTELRGALRLVQADALAWSGTIDRAASCALEAIELLSAGSAGWFRAVGRAVTALGILGRIDDAELYALRSREQQPQPRTLAFARRGWSSWAADPSAARVVCLARAAEQLFLTGREGSARTLLAEAERSVPDLRLLEPVALARLELARALRAKARGLPGECTDRLRAATECFERVGDGRGLWRTRCELGLMYVELGEFEQAEDALEQSEATARRAGLAVVEGWALRHRALARLAKERWSEAMTLAKSALHLAQGRGLLRLEVCSRIALAEALCGLQQFDASMEEARQAIAIADAAERVEGLAILAQTERAAKQPFAAIAHAEEAIALAEAGGTAERGEGLARSLVVQARLFDDANDGKQAREARARARSILLARAGTLGTTARGQRFLEAFAWRREAMRG